MLTLGKGKVGGFLEINNEAWVQKMLESVKHGTLDSYAVSVALFLEHIEKAGKNISTFFDYGVASTTVSKKAENWVENRDNTSKWGKNTEVGAEGVRAV